MIRYRNTNFTTKPILETGIITVASLSSVTGQISEMPANNAKLSGFCAELVVRSVPSQVPSHALRIKPGQRDESGRLFSNLYRLTHIVRVFEIVS